MEKRMVTAKTWTFMTSRKLTESSLFISQTEYDSSDSKEVQIEDLVKDLQNFAGSGGIFAGQGGVLNRIQVKFFKIIREFAQIN